ncbi:MAG: ABC transporter permease subunit [Verrucomicrobiota bacterium]
MIGSTPSRLLLIARNTFLEAVRQKFFNVLVILSIALIGSSNFFRQFDFGSSELKFIADLGLGSILLFGSILSVVVTAQLFFSEIENRTALTILAKPVQRWEFIVGKFLGIFFVIAAFVSLMFLLLAAMLYWRESTLMENLGGDFTGGRIVQYGGILMMALTELLKFGILVAITLFIASFSNTNLYTVIISFFVMLICQLQYIAKDSWGDLENPIVRGIVWLLASIFPNLQMFNIGEQLIFTPVGATVEMSVYFGIVGYGLIYIVAFLGLSAYSFKNREI